VLLKTPNSRFCVLKKNKGRAWRLWWNILYNYILPSSRFFFSCQAKIARIAFTTCTSVCPTAAWKAVRQRQVPGFFIYTAYKTTLNGNNNNMRASAGGEYKIYNTAYSIIIRTEEDTRHLRRLAHCRDPRRLIYTSSASNV